MPLDAPWMLDVELANFMVPRLFISRGPSFILKFSPRNWLEEFGRNQ